MRERDMKTAKMFGVLERIQEFEKKLLEVNHVVDVEFDLDGFWSDIRQVIFLPKYDIPVSLPDYYAVRRAMLEEVLNIAKEFGLNSSGDRIEDYGEHFYIVRDCDDTWVLQKDETYAEPEIVTAIEEAAREVVGKYDWTMPKYSLDEYDDYNEYDSECLDIGHERRGEICGFVKQRLVVAGKIASEDDSYDEIIEETAWDEITNCICENMDEITFGEDVPKTRYFMMDADGVDVMTCEGKNATVEDAMKAFWNMHGYIPDVVKTIDENGETLEVLKDVREGVDTIKKTDISETRYFEVSLVNYDDNNVPYNVGTVHVSVDGPVDKESVAEFCRDELGMDFEEVFSIEETTLDEVLEYVDEAEIPVIANGGSLVDEIIGSATSRSEATKNNDKQVIELEKE